MVTEIPDDVIMERVKNGDLAEMSVLFERYHIRLYNFFHKLTRNKIISQDLTQNLFYRMIRYKNSYKSDHSVKSWMYQMARNLHIDYCREEKRSDDLFVKTDSYPVDVTDESTGFHEDDYERLDEAFARLSTSQKELIILSRYQGLKYEEISEILDQSVPAIKVAMHRTINQLRAYYFKQNKDRVS
jgi:RNA polymerase sigma-70 factor (ECF subfamily)